MIGVGASEGGRGIRAGLDGGLGLGFGGDGVGVGGLSAGLGVCIENTVNQRHRSYFCSIQKFRTPQALAQNAISRRGLERRVRVLFAYLTLLGLGRP